MISKRMAIVVAVLILIGGAFGTSIVQAASKHNGACSGFSGSVGGHRYAGVKCYLDTAPGTYIIRSSVRERDDKERYRKLLRVPNRLVRCTLTRGHSDWSGTKYKISNC